MLWLFVNKRDASLTFLYDRSKVIPYLRLKYANMRFVNLKNVSAA